jgi:hypothetical protein
MPRIVLPSVVGLAVPCSSTSSHKRHDWGGGGLIEHKKCVLIFPTTFIRNIFLRRIRRDIVINIHRSSRKVLVILVRFQ